MVKYPFLQLWAAKPLLFCRRKEPSLAGVCALPAPGRSSAPCIRITPHSGSKTPCIFPVSLPCTKAEGKNLIPLSAQAWLPREAFLASLHQPFLQQEPPWLETLLTSPFTLCEAPPKPLSPTLPLLPRALHPSSPWSLSVFCTTALQSTDGTRKLPGGAGSRLKDPPGAGA